MPKDLPDFLESQELAGLTAIVTGGGAGIGLTTARLLAARGANVAVLDLPEIPAAPDPLTTVQCDVGSDESVRAAVSTVVERFGGLDILYNNVGIRALGTIEDCPDEVWAHVFDVNVIGTVRMTRAALPYLRASRHPAIVNACSTVGALGRSNMAPYATSKGAMIALTLSMAADYVDAGIRVNGISPSSVETPALARVLAASDDPDAVRHALSSQQPNGRLVTQAEVAAAVGYLVSPSAASTTGVILPVDGGVTGVSRVPWKDAAPTGVLASSDHTS